MPLKNKSYHLKNKANLLAIVGGNTIYTTVAFMVWVKKALLTKIFDRLSTYIG